MVAIHTYQAMVAVSYFPCKVMALQKVTVTSMTELVDALSEEEANRY